MSWWKRRFLSSIRLSMAYPQASRSVRVRSASGSKPSRKHWKSFWLSPWQLATILDNLSKLPQVTTNIRLFDSLDTFDYDLTMLGSHGYMSTREVAKLLGISRQTLYNWLKQGRIPEPTRHPLTSY